MSEIRLTREQSLKLRKIAMVAGVPPMRVIDTLIEELLKGIRAAQTAIVDAADEITKGRKRRKR